MHQQSALEFSTPLLKFKMADFKKGLIVVLENACLETVKVGQEYELLNCDDHIQFMKKFKRDPAMARPDITHQCLLTLLDSPLNKAGLLKIYVHTENHQLIDVNPFIRIPRTFPRFAGLMVKLFHKLHIQADGDTQKLLKLIKNPVIDHLPRHCRKIGTSYSATTVVDIFDYVPTLLPKVKVENETKEPETILQSTTKNQPKEKSNNDQSNKRTNALDQSDEKGKSHSKKKQKVGVKEGVTIKEEPSEEKVEKFEIPKEEIVVFVIGAMSHGKVKADYVDTEISFSHYPLSASVACGRLCNAFEKHWGII